MVLKLYGMRTATCTQRVLTTLAELNITDYEFITVNLYKGEQNTAAHLELQPWGKVPVLEDDGYVVYESRAICKYLAQKYAGQGNYIMPGLGEVKEYGLFEQACSIEQQYLDRHIFGLWFENFIKPARGWGATDPAKVKEHIENLHTHFTVYEKILSKQKYLAGDQCTLVDLFHLTDGTMAMPYGLKDVIDTYPHVAKWWESLAERESWKQVVANAQTPGT